MDTGAPTPAGAAADLRRARRWFWALTAVAVLAAGTLRQGLRSAPGAGTGVLVLVSGLVLTASVAQAARILFVLAGPPRLPRRLFPHPSEDRARPMPAHHTRPSKEK